MSEKYDAIIVGGGIGGSALATMLARADKSVLLLEKSTVYRDLVRGEWMAPWGVAEAQRIGLYDDLIAAGAHHVTRHITYGETIDAATAESAPLPLEGMVPGIAGPLCLGHPAHCQLLFDLASKAGATALRGVTSVSVSVGATPSVTYTIDGVERTASCRIIVGADGRGSLVRRAAGIELHRDPTHHLFSGMLIENAHGWPADTQMIGTEDDVHYLAFPQGDGRIRLYLGYATEQAQRLTGDKGQQAFLDAFRLASVPASGALCGATPAGPCNSYPNEDAWTDVPYAEGVVLIGDAAGWNDPIIGQGLSITYRDVRFVGEALCAHDEWRPEIFAEYAEERAERLRRLRFSAKVVSKMQAEFGLEAVAVRRRAEERQRNDPSLLLPLLASMMGPDRIPEPAFTPETWERIFGA